MKRDDKGYGTYTLNPFAFYPKNIKNTITNLMSNSESNLVNNMKKYNDAFTDFSYLENP
jgi:hypothetical protein